MYQFDTDWAQEIADISTLPEFQNASVVLFVPGEASYNDDDEYVVNDPTLIYKGRCRVVGLRSAFNDIQAGNPDSLKPVRVQLPEVPPRMPENTQAYFTDGGRNANLTSYVFNVNSDFNSSHVAAYTLELTVSMDAVDNDLPEFP